MNRKGFMMAELVVVSSIVMVTLASLYLSYSKLYSTYATRIDYYDIDTLYELAYYRDILIDNEMLNNLLTNLSTDTTPFKKLNADLELETSDTIYLIYNNRLNIDSNILATERSIKSTFKDYISYVSSSVSLTNANYVMLMERCITDDDCKYAYLEVYDGTEG